MINEIFIICCAIIVGKLMTIATDHKSYYEKAAKMVVEMI